MNEHLRKQIIVNLEGLVEAVDGFRGVALLALIDDLEDYPSWDNDPGVNYIVGWLHGVMAALNIGSTADLLKEFNIPQIPSD